jgi:hypothetical protein
MSAVSFSRLSWCGVTRTVSVLSPAVRPDLSMLLGLPLRIV